MKLLILDKLEINQQLKTVLKKVEVFYCVSRDIFNMVADNVARICEVSFSLRNEVTEREWNFVNPQMCEGFCVSENALTQLRDAIRATMCKSCSGAETFAHRFGALRSGGKSKHKSRYYY